MSTSAAAAAATQGSSIQEYSIRVPKNVKKRYHVMRFNATLGVDFSKWSTVKMERENNMKEFRGIDEETPKFGAGSEFGKEAREEARRKKLGIMTRKYKPDAQPWILKAGGSLGKKFKGIREGGVSENASYYVFTHAPDGAIEAFPLNEWYKFQPIQRYKSLSAEEAEQEFGKRNRVLNYFSLMLRKRLKGDEETVADGEEQEKGKKGPGKKTKDLKISDMDEWMDSSEDDSEESGAEKKDEEEKAEKKKKNKKADNKKKKSKRDTDLEALEDSDDGDNEGRELDYISDSSESEPEEPGKNLQGVAEEKALRKLLTSDEDSEDDENKSEKEQSNEDEEEKKEDKEKDEKEGSSDKKKNKKKQKKKEVTKKKKGEKEKPGKAEETSSDFSSDSTDSESEKKDKNKKEKEEESKEKEKESNSANSSRSASPLQGTSQNNKRKLPTIPETVSKKPKYDTSLSNYIPGSSESGITEDAVRRYLMRKPMTTTELLQKFKSKKTGLSSEQLVNIMTQILKKINPVKQTIKGKMYLSIKA